jgi:hypothetical protein
MKTTLEKTKRFAVLAVMVTVFFAWSCDQFQDDVVPDETKTTVEDTNFFTAENSSAVIDLKSLVKSYGDVTLTITDQPNNGKLQKLQDAVFSYKPKKDFKGSDMFIFRVSSKNQTVKTDSVIIHVGDEPLEVPCGLHAQFDSTVIVQPGPREISIDVLANDLVCGVSPENLKIDIYHAPGHGEAIVNDTQNTIEYHAADGHIGGDWFLYRIMDKTDTAKNSLALVSVWTLGDQSCEPVLRPDFLHFLEKVSNVYNIGFFDNDELCDANPENSVFTIVKNGDNGTATVAGFGWIEYEATESAIEHGDSLVYRLCYNDVCYTQGVRLTFEPLQCSVLSLGDTVDIPFDAISLTRRVTVLDNDQLCGNAVEIGITKAPVNGTASFDGFELIYTANSQTSPADSVRYMACNQDNKCGVAWLTIRRE